MLQEHSWSVKDTKAAVDRVRTVADLVPAQTILTVVPISAINRSVVSRLFCCKDSSSDMVSTLTAVDEVAGGSLSCCAIHASYIHHVGSNSRSSY